MTAPLVIRIIQQSTFFLTSQGTNVVEHWIPCYITFYVLYHVYIRVPKTILDYFLKGSDKYSIH